MLFRSNDTATTEIYTDYYTLSLHDALPIPADCTYVLLGYDPDLAFVRACGVAVDPATGIPVCDPESFETEIPGLYVAGSLQAGYATNRIFIENSREHAPRLVAHLVRRLGRA